MIGVIIDYEFVFLIFAALAVILVVLDVVALFRWLIRSGRIQIKFHLPEFKLFGSKQVAELEVLEEAAELKYPKLRNVFAQIKRLRLLIVNICILAVLGLLGYNMFLINPGVESSYPVNDQRLSNYETPVSIIFDRPIDEKTFKPYIFPEIKGTWKVEPVYNFLPFLKRKAVFYPEESMFESKVFIYYAGIGNVYGVNDMWEYGLDSLSVKLPTRADANTDNEPIDFAVDGNLQFKLDENFGNFVDFNFSIDPAIPFNIEKTDNNLLNINFDGTLDQSTEYSYKLFEIPQRYNIQTLAVVEQGDKTLLKEGKFTTIKEPLIKSIEPSGSEVLAESQIKIVFDQVMKEDSVKSSFTINPAIDGVLEKSDDYTYIYKNTVPFNKDTKYEIKLAKGITSIKGGVIEKDIISTFTTIGKVKVTSFSPGYNSSNIKRVTNINVTFNQDVDHPSAQGKFSISPSVAGSFNWSGNTMSFNPSADLAYQVTYTATEAAGVKSVHGIDSTDASSTRFTTELQYFTLNVPIYHQPVANRYACNFYASAMALAYKAGHSFDPMALYSQVVKDPTPIQCDGSQNVTIWGNPYSGYVGNVYGTPVAGCNRSGYGVYWGPVSAVISNYRTNAVKTGWNVSDMLHEVENGNPVVIWAHNGYSSSGQIFYWMTPSNQQIRAVSGMHSYVVVGFVGSADNPQSVILNDPNRGRWTISIGYFKTLWSYFNNSGIVVY